MIKNVAGYDVSRLCAGAWGTLGVIEQATFKVLPRPRSEITKRLEVSAARALVDIAEWLRAGVPITASFYDGQYLLLRLSSSADNLKWAEKYTGGETVDNACWADIRDQRHPFFTALAEGDSLWRLSLPMTHDCGLAGSRVFEWHGGLHWLKSNQPANTIHQHAKDRGGHAWLFRGGKTNDEIFAPLPPPLRAIHQRLKKAFDPDGIININVAYGDL